MGNLENRKLDPYLSYESSRSYSLNDSRFEAARPHITLQNLRHENAAIGLLERFQDRGEKARASEAAAVENVNVFRFVTRRAPEADVRAAGLEGFEVGAARNL